MTRHLIHVGYPKTGSTYLKQWFLTHPEVAFVEQGIAGFSRIKDLETEAIEGRRSAKWRVTSYEALADPRPPTDGGPPSADLPTIEQQTYICTMLASLFPNATVLIVTRGFRAMIMSAYSQWVRSGGAEDLEQLLTDLPEGPLWDYAYLIDLYKSHFGTDNVVTLPYELLCEEPTSFLDILAKRLGIGMIPFDAVPINPSLSPIELRWYPRFARTVLALPVGDRLRRALFRRYVAAAVRRKFGPLIRTLQAVRPAKPVTFDLIPQQVVDRFSGNARCFREDPLYKRYAADYLL